MGAGRGGGSWRLVRGMGHHHHGCQWEERERKGLEGGGKMGGGRGGSVEGFGHWDGCKGLRMRKLEGGQAELRT